MAGSTFSVREYLKLKPILDLDLYGEPMPEERITGSKSDLDLSAELTYTRAYTVVPGMHDREYEDRLNKLKLSSLHYCRTRGDMIELYKHTHGMYHIDAKYIKLDQSQTTRGYSFKLAKERVNKRV